MTSISEGARVMLAVRCETAPGSNRIATRRCARAERIPTALAALLWGLFASASALAIAPDAIKKPELTVGDRWTYNGHTGESTFRNTITIDQLTDREIRVISETVPSQASGRLQQVFDRQWNLIEVLKDGKSLVKYSPRLSSFEFPLETGKTWGQFFTATNTVPKTRFSESRAHGQVLGWEVVIVPAGNFRAMKVEVKIPGYAGEKSHRIFQEKELMGGVQEFYWYSPEVKRFVKYEASTYVNQRLIGRRGLDLIEYSVAP